MFEYRMKKSEIYEIEEYKRIYGDVKPSEILKKKTYNKFRCPQCNGRGYIQKLNDEEWQRWRIEGREYYYDVECDLCKCIGWTDKQYKPKMIQKGWEECAE